MENEENVRKRLEKGQGALDKMDKDLFVDLIYDACCHLKEITDHVRETAPQIVESMNSIIKHFQVHNYLCSKITSSSSHINQGCLKLNVMTYKIQDLFRNISLTFPQMFNVSSRLITAIDTLVKIIQSQEKQCAVVISIYLELKSKPGSRIQVSKHEHEMALMQTETSLSILRTFCQLLDIAVSQIKNAWRIYDTKNRQQCGENSNPNDDNTAITDSKSTSKKPKAESDSLEGATGVSSNEFEIKYKFPDFYEIFGVINPESQTDSQKIKRISEIYELVDEIGSNRPLSPIQKAQIEASETDSEDSPIESSELGDKNIPKRNSRGYTNDRIGIINEDVTRKLDFATPPEPKINLETNFSHPPLDYRTSWDVARDSGELFENKKGLAKKKSLTLPTTLSRSNSMRRMLSGVRKRMSSMFKNSNNPQ